MNIVVEGSEVKECWDFAQKVAPNQKSNEFDNKELTERKLEKIVSDTFIGKLGETAVQKWLFNCGVHVELDWSVKPRGEWDIADICYKDWSVDVKCTKSTGKFFLIDWSKLQFRADAGQLPHFFVMTKLGTDMSKIVKDGSGACKIELAGFVDTRELTKANSKLLTIRRGENLPNTNVGLATSNFAMPIKDMDKDWEQLASRIKNEQAFTLESYVPPGNCQKTEKMPVQEKDELPMKYSLLLAGADILKYDKSRIEEYIQAGMKCLLFVDEKQAVIFADLEKKYDRSFFQLYVVTSSDVPALTIYDGVRSSRQQRDFEKLCQLPLNKVFNHEQYDVEHFNTKDMLIVKAAAGTGKTTVMIDRIMFLLATVKNLRPADIAMITFTNKATASMIDKLQKRAMAMFDLTHKQRWYEVMEELSQMQISTIDSFFYTVLKNDGSVLGYGTDSSIKSFIYERKRILGEIVNDFFKQHNHQTFLDANVMPIHEYVDKAFNMWEKLHSRGYFEEAIEGMRFGTAADKQDSIINENLQRIIVEAEKRYQLFKKKHNAYTINDIKADMDALTRSEDFVMRQEKFRFLFIDEFQDTDSSQIRSAAWLQKMMGCQLFVVGDVKQSIYRFRGAEESAFDELKKCLKQNGVSEEHICTAVLKKNYRTAVGVMNEMNNLFKQWGDSGLLVWDGSVMPCSESRGNLHKVKCRRNDAAIIPEIQKWRPKSKQICVLTRTNNQVAKVAEMCRAEGIFCRAKLSGGFYRSEPVRDLYALLGGLLYPGDTRHLYNLLLTPYTAMVPDGEKLARMQGDEEAVRAYLEGLLAKDGWQSILKRLRVEPFFPMLDALFDQLRPLERYTSLRHNNFPLYGHSADADYDVDCYLLNLNKLMRILYENFTGEYASLLGVFAFLENKMQTDRTEDCVYPDKEPEEGKYPVEVMTVHKAKGLEFETVILPYMNNPFFQDEDYDKFKGFITEEKDGQLNVGWAFQDRGKLRKNDCYENMTADEQQAARREEARILYVAMTRTIENLVCIISREPQENTWGEYVQNCQEVK